MQSGQSKMCRWRNSGQLSPQDARACSPATLCSEGPRSSWVPMPLRNSSEWLSSTISAQPSQSILNSLGICSSSLHELCVWLNFLPLWTRDLVQCPVLHQKWPKSVPVGAWSRWVVLTAAVTAAWVWAGIPLCVWGIQKQSYIQDTFPAAIKYYFFLLI